MKKEEIGMATLYCGDSREILPDLGATVVITDPPYGVGIKYGTHYDDDRDTYWDWFLPALASFKASCRTMIFTHRVPALREIRDWDWVGVWNKPGAFGSRLGNSCVLPHWEPIFMYGIHGQGTKSEYTADVFTFNPEPAKAGAQGIGREKWEAEFTTHPCPKPVPLYNQLVKAFAQDVDTVYDPFMGSGTTGVAALNLGKKFVGIELGERFFDQACEKIENAQRQERLFA